MCDVEPLSRQLLDGFRKFEAQDFERQRARYQHLADKGQKPPVMVIACSDSRVDPAMVFHAGPGEMFVLRHIAALVPPCEKDGRHHSASAAIEFAVTQLEVEQILVFGHGGCGGIAASLSHQFDESPEGDGGFIHHWMDIVAPARDRLMARGQAANSEKLQLELELEAIRLSLINLTQFPHVVERMRNGDLALHGAHFDIRTGTLRALSRSSGDFEIISNFISDDPQVYPKSTQHADHAAPFAVDWQQNSQLG